jgi:cytochrome c556
MNDDFLYRLRTEPSPELAARLKAKLGLALRKRVSSVRLILALLVCGTALALVAPSVRHSVARLMERPRVDQTVPGKPDTSLDAASTPDVLAPQVATAPHADEPERVRRPLSRPANYGHASKSQAAGKHNVGELPADELSSHSEPRYDVATSSPPLSLAYPAPSENPTPEEDAWRAAILRRSLAKVLGWAMAPLDDMVHAKMPFDAATARRSAMRIEQLAPMISETFQYDTRKFDVPTRALDAIWTNDPDFQAKANAMTEAARALSAAARTGDGNATLNAVTRAGMACSECHDLYRAH